MSQLSADTVSHVFSYSVFEHNIWNDHRVFVVEQYHQCQGETITKLDAKFSSFSRNDIESQVRPVTTQRMFCNICDKFDSLTQRTVPHKAAQKKLAHSIMHRGEKNESIAPYV